MNTIYFHKMLLFLGDTHKHFQHLHSEFSIVVCCDLDILCSTDGTKKLTTAL